MFKNILSLKAFMPSPFDPKFSLKKRFENKELLLVNLGANFLKRQTICFGKETETSDVEIQENSFEKSLKILAEEKAPFALSFGYKTCIRQKTSDSGLAQSLFINSIELSETFDSKTIFKKLEPLPIVRCFFSISSILNSVLLTCKQPFIILDQGRIFYIDPKQPKKFQMADLSDRGSEKNWLKAFLEGEEKHLCFDTGTSGDLVKELKNVQIISTNLELEVLANA